MLNNEASNINIILTTEQDPCSFPEIYSIVKESCVKYRIFT